jgi:DNA-binding transcriptional regulator YhcF (GntR family)
MILSKSEIIEQEILNDIYAGRYTDKLPSEKEMAKIYNTSPVTAAKILNRLKDKNIVKRIGGRGTFINHEGLHRKVKIRLPFSDEILEEIRLELKNSFPEISFEFIRMSGGVGDNLESVDISYLTSYFPDSYDKYFSPLPEDMLYDFLDDGKYYSNVFAAHKYNNSYFGIPYSASPCVLIGNKELLGKYLDKDSGKCVSLDELSIINNRLKNENIALFDCRAFRKGTVLDFIFSSIPEEELERMNVSGVSLEKMDGALNDFYSVYSDSISKGASFMKGEAVFARFCRQSLGRNFNLNDFSWDLFPLSFGVSRSDILASEALFVSVDTSNQEKLFEICRAFLEPGIQNIIGRHKYGLPVLKSAALESLDSSEFRDDVFFNEMKNVVFNYELFEKPLMNSFISDIEALFERNISFEEFKARAKNLYRLNEKNREAREMFDSESDF